MGQNSKALTIRDFFPPILWGWKIGEFFQKKANLDECGLVWFSFMYTLPYARDFMSTEFNNKLKWGCTYRYTVHQLAKINSYLPTYFSLHVKRNQLAHLIKNLALCSRVFFHNFNFEFSKRLISQFGSCVGSNKRMKTQVQVTITWT